MMLNLALTESDIRVAIADHVERHFGYRPKPSELHIEVKSKQNYRSEWEHAEIRLDVKILAQMEGK